MRICFTSLMVAFYFAASVAQQTSKKFDLGLSLEPQLNISNIKFARELVENKQTLGIAIGGDIHYKLSNSIALKSGMEVQLVLLRQFDYEPNFPDDFMNGELDVYKSYYRRIGDYTFLAIPLEIKVLTGNKPNRIYIDGGLKASYNVISSGYIELIESGVNTHIADSEPLDINPFQLYGTIGLGYQWVKDTKTYFVGPQFQTSFSEIYPGSQDSGHGNFSFLGLRVGVN